MMATQVIPGALRETNNPLLLKAEIGKPLKRGFNLPSDHFTYGKNSQGKNFGTAETFSWKTKLAPLNQKDQLKRRDFISMNKSATQSGLITAQEHFQYRATHDASYNKHKTDERNRRSKHVSPTVVYGVPTKPSTPVFDLLEHKYQDQWLEQNRLSAQVTERRKNTEASKLHKCYSETRASRLRRHSPPVDPTPLWQMSKFQKNALPALQTFRSDDARQKAYRHHSSDCTSRTGVFGHGNYEGAKS